MAYDNFTIGTAEYKRAFWDKAMRGFQAPYEAVKGGRASHDTLVLPADSSRKYQEALRRESFFRRIATCVSVPQSNSDIWVSQGDELAEWTPEGGAVKINETADQFTRYCIHCHKLAILTRLDNDYVHDIGFDVESYLTAHMAKRFGRAEEDAFLNGTGRNMPTGIFHASEGAQTGIAAPQIDFDGMIKLYLSVKPEYRRDGVWVMNDETALTLRTLKDADGNYLWNHNSGAILGRPVHISEFMPSAVPGSAPIAFGDFSYYWIVDRFPLSVRTLQERFALRQQTGYLAYEFLDGRLTRPEAVKLLRIAG